MTAALSVRARFLRITAPLIFASVMGALGVIEYKAYRSALADLDSAVALMMRTQAASLVTPMWNLDSTQVGLTLAAIAANSTVVSASAFDENGTLIAQAGRRDAEGSNDRMLRRDVVRGSGATARKIGALEVVITARDIWQTTRNRILLGVSIALLAVLMEVSAALFALRQIVGKPLARLMQAITVEKTGGRRAPIRIETMDEMGQVSAAFNEMLQQQDAFETELAKRARLDQEMSIGRDLQMAMVPGEFSDITADRPLAMSAAMEPAREVGGDFYDAFVLSDDLVCLCIGDVADKGVPAALYMAVTKTLIRALAKGQTSSARIVQLVNAELCQNASGGMFVTVFLAILNLRTGKLVYTNAGHNPPCLIRGTGEVQAIEDRNGPVIGAETGVEFTETSLLLLGGETLFLYTDGVTEAIGHDGAFFGPARLRALLARQADAPPAQLVRCIAEAVGRYETGGPHSDDVTLLAMRFTGAFPTLWSGRCAVSSDAIAALSDEMSQALCGLDPQLVATAQLVLDELGSNLVLHQTAPTPAQIDVTACALRPDLRLTIADTAGRFDPGAIPPPDVASDLAARRVGGLGLHLIQRLSDGFRYTREGDRNVYRLVLRGRPDPGGIQMADATQKA